MKTWMKIGIPVGVLAVLAAWYAFRPERLVVNRRVNEAMPNSQGTLSAQPLESGRFYSILHPTAGIATIYHMEDGTRILRLTSFSTGIVVIAAAIDYKSHGDEEWVQWATLLRRQTSRAVLENLNRILDVSGAPIVLADDVPANLRPQLRLRIFFSNSY